MQSSNWSLFRVGNAVMAVLFCLAAGLQLNDPDPIRWLSIYGSACVLAGMAASDVRVPIGLICSVGLVALGWGIAVELDIDRFVEFRELFQSWQMKDAPVELAREAGGLFIVAAWAAALAVHSWLLRNRVDAGTSS